MEDPTEQINLLEKDIGSARKNKLNVLAPIWFARAEASFNESKELQNQGKELSEIFQKISEARAQLKEAEESARVARTALPDVIKARDLARDANATILEEEYSEVEEQFIALTKAIEDNNLNWAKRNETEVAKAFRKLELRAIKKQTIGEARKFINQAEIEDAKKIGEHSVKGVMSLSNNASYIQNNVIPAGFKRESRMLVYTDAHIHL